MKTADVIVIGGGIIGCAIARQLARDKLQVLILDRQQPGQEASWAAAGMLAPQSETDAPDAFFELCLSSRRMYPEYVAELEEETHLDVEYRDEGTIDLAFTEDQTLKQEARAHWQLEYGLDVELLDSDAVRQFLPSVNPTVRSAMFVPGDHQVNPRQLTRALILSALRAGVEIRSGRAVQEILMDGERAVGVRVLDERLSAGLIVNAAGCWSGQIQSPNRPSVRPIRGQIIALDGLKSGSSELPYVVYAPGCYLVPRRDGQVLIGSTTENVGFIKANTALGISSLLSSAIATIPALKEAPIMDMWSGLRPDSPDHLPLIGYAAENLILATGHYRNGILLTPITAQLVRDLVFGQFAPQSGPKSGPDWLKIFDPQRRPKSNEAIEGSISSQ